MLLAQSGCSPHFSGPPKSKLLCKEYAVFVEHVVKITPPSGTTSYLGAPDLWMLSPHRNSPSAAESGWHLRRCDTERAKWKDIHCPTIASYKRKNSALEACLALTLNGRLRLTTSQHPDGCIVWVRQYHILKSQAKPSIKARKPLNQAITKDKGD